MPSAEAYLHPLLRFDGQMIAAVAQRGSEVLLDDVVEQEKEKPTSRKDSKVKHLFCIGSATKIFTGFALYQLLKDHTDITEDSTLSDIGLHIFGAENVSIRELLTHTSILPWGNDRLLGPQSRPLLDKDPTMALILAYIKKDDADNAKTVISSNKIFRYNNIGYILLGLVMEHIAKKSYGDIIKKKILEPRNMSHTYVCRSDYSKRNVNEARAVSAYIEVDEGDVIEIDKTLYLDDTVFLPAFGICSCLEDMQSFFSYLLQEQSGDQGYFRFSQSLSRFGYGAGVSYELGGLTDQEDIGRMSKHADTIAKSAVEASLNAAENSEVMLADEEGPLKPLEHSGFVRGYECLYEIRPAENYFFVCCSNTSGLDDVVHNVRHLLKRREQPLSNRDGFLMECKRRRNQRLQLVAHRINEQRAYSAQPLELSLLADLVGTYKVGDDGPRMTIKEREGKCSIVIHTCDKGEEQALSVRFEDDYLTFCPTVSREFLFQLGDDFFHKSATKLGIERDEDSGLITGLLRSLEEGEGEMAIVYNKISGAGPV